MNKETSSRVSTIASRILNMKPHHPDNPLAYGMLLADAKILAASCMSQDEHPGQKLHEDAARAAGASAGIDFHSRLKDEREDLDRRLTALNSYLMHNPDRPNPRHNAMLLTQAGLMSELLAVIDERLADIAISDRSSPVEEIEAIDEDDGA